MKKLIISIALLGLAACGSPSASTNSGSAVAAKPQAEKMFTLKDYAKIKTGMTVAQSEKATGFKAKETSENSMEMMGTTITTTGYIIANPDGSSASFSVQNGAIASKMHMGLK